MANAGLLDFFLFGARRLETYALSHLDTLEAAIAYRSALRASSETQGELVDRAEKAIRRSRQQYETLRGQFIELWHRENRPYALEWTLKRYDAALARHDLLLKQLGTARASAVLSQPLPPAKEVGLDLVETNS